MNVRIENQNLRFKITEKELTQLLDARCVHTKINILDKVFVICVNPTDRAESIEIKLVQDIDEVYLNLLVSPKYVQDLYEMGRDRSGVSTECGDLSVSLQVDIRKDTRRKAKG